MKSGYVGVVQKPLSEGVIPSVSAVSTLSWRISEPAEESQSGRENVSRQLRGLLIKVVVRTRSTAMSAVSREVTRLVVMRKCGRIEGESKTLWGIWGRSGTKHFLENNLGCIL